MRVFQQIPSVPTLVMAKSNFNEMLVDQCPVLTRKFWPCVWQPSATMQHWVYHLLRNLRSAYEDPASKWTREKLLTKDGHGITIDRLDDDKVKVQDSAHIILIINCSMSGSHAYESFTYAEQLLAKGFRVYSLNLRGAANAQLKTAGDKVPIAFNTLSGMGDLRETVNWLTKRHKGRRLTLTSFGTASAMVLNYLNTEGKRAPVDSAVCISPAMQMESLAELGWLENRMELEKLKVEVLHRHADELEAALGEEKVQEAEGSKTVGRFHELVTMQVCGDEPDDDMRYSDYLKAHSLSTLGDNIERPVMFLCSKDDPVYKFKEVMPPAIVKQFKTHPHAILVVASHGGHNCLFESFFSANWASRVTHQVRVKQSDPFSFPASFLIPAVTVAVPECGRMCCCTQFARIVGAMHEAEARRK